MKRSLIIQPRIVHGYLFFTANSYADIIFCTLKQTFPGRFSYLVFRILRRLRVAYITAALGSLLTFRVYILRSVFLFLLRFDIIIRVKRTGYV